LAITAAFLFQATSRAAEPTAFALFREGDRYLGEEAKGRLVEIRSDKSVGSVTPVIWYIVYLDPTSSGKATEIKFAAGKKADVKHLGKFLGIEKKREQIPSEKLKVDSDQAIQTALAEPLLKNLTIKATQLTLEPWQGIPAWKVELWAAKVQKPTEMAKVGEVFIDVQDGKVIRSDLKISRAD
jgi:hypothetical protein